MRWPAQLALIAVLGAAGYGGYEGWRRGLIPGLPGPAAGGPAQATPGRGAGGPVAVEVAPVGRGAVVEVTEAVGTTRAFESVAIAPKTAGIVETIRFEEGQLVKAGDELVRLDAAEKRADVEAAVAGNAQAKALRDDASQKLDRSKQLTRSGAVTEARIDELDATLRGTEASIKAGEARLRAAQARLDDLVVRAPFAGRVGIRAVSVGAYVEPRTVITTLDDLSRVRLDFAVPENLLDKLRVGSTIAARAAAFGERRFEGRVAVIDTRIDPVTRAVKLTAVIDNPDGSLRPGMFMNVALEVARREDAILVPEEAVVGEGPRQVAFVVVDGKIDRRLLKLGQRAGGRVEVYEGLKEGETLVVRGVQRVRAGLAVNAKPLVPDPKEAGAAPDAAAAVPSSASTSTAKTSAAEPAVPRPSPEQPVPAQPGAASPARAADGTPPRPRASAPAPVVR